ARRHFAYNSSRDCAAASPMNDTPSGAGNGWNTTNVRPNASGSRRTTDRLPLKPSGSAATIPCWKLTRESSPVACAPRRARRRPGAPERPSTSLRSPRWRLRSSPRRRAGNIVAERLRQQAIHAQLPLVAKDRQPDRHARVARFRRRAISPEQAVPPRQVEAEIAVGLAPEGGKGRCV